MNGDWISTKDRLPAKDQFFLAYGPGLGNNTIGPSMDICTFDGQLWVEDGTEIADLLQMFTHWMPLPEPP